MEINERLIRWQAVPCSDIRRGVDEGMEAILERDQRTTSHRTLNQNQHSRSSCSTIYKNDLRFFAPTCHSSIKSERSTKWSKKTRVMCTSDLNSRGSLEKTYSSVKMCDPCLVSSCSGPRRGIRRATYTATVFPTWLRLGSLLLTFLAVSVNAAPTMTFENRRLISPPKWVNPCGLTAEDFEGDLDVVQLKDEQLLTQVVMQAQTALSHALIFRDDYIKRTFKVDFDELHSTWKDNHYDWLPGPDQIPKHLGEHLGHEFLDKIEVHMLNTVLSDAYQYMQKYAVGLEQIVWDQEDHGLAFRKQFKDAEFHLRTVLCELQVALVERGATLRPDVTRDAMSTEYRAMASSDTHRQLRDWLIFRDYMNGLEFIVQVFEHLRRRLEY